MKRSIFDPEIQKLVEERMEKLTTESKGRWGVMTVEQMLRHLAEGFKLPLGEVKMEDKSTFLGRTLIRYFVTSGYVPSEAQAKKRPIQTFKEIDVVKAGIQAGYLEAEKANLRQMIRAFIEKGEYPPRHPFFGKFRKKHWGFWAWTHIHYHFSQFGV